MECCAKDKIITFFNCFFKKSSYAIFLVKLTQNAPQHQDGIKKKSRKGSLLKKAIVTTWLSGLVSGTKATSSRAQKIKSLLTVVGNYLCNEKLLKCQENRKRFCKYSSLLEKSKFS